MNRSLLYAACVCTTVILYGCGVQNAPVEVLEIRAEAICRTPFNAPLSNDEITALTSLVAALPARKVPDFQTAFDFAAEETGFTPEDLVQRYRKRFRDTLDPVRQSQLWQRDPELNAVLEQHGVDPDAFAMLVIRVSSAWAAAAIVDQQGPAHCRSLRILADERLTEIVASIHDVDARPELHDRDTRQHLVTALHETVALTEFLGLLERVPAESVPVLVRHRDQLAPVMPAVQTVGEFERFLESSPTVIPVGYETR